MQLELTEVFNAVPLVLLGLSFTEVVIAAGCGGGSGGGNPPTPAPTGTATATATATATSTSSSSSADVTWMLGGSAASATYAQGTTPSAASLATYHNITVSAQFIAPTSGSGKINFSDALNGAQSVTDVTPNTLPADNATSGYTPIIYVSADNTASNDIIFGTTVPTIQVSDTGLGSYASCNLDVYGSQGNGLMWFTVPNSGTPNGAGVTVGGGTLDAGNNVDFKGGHQQIIAISCK
jgi:hypothetical protein